MPKIKINSQKIHAINEKCILLQYEKIQIKRYMVNRW